MRTKLKQSFLGLAIAVLLAPLFVFMLPAKTAVAATSAVEKARNIPLLESFLFTCQLYKSNVLRASDMYLTRSDINNIYDGTPGDTGDAPDVDEGEGAVIGYVNDSDKGVAKCADIVDDVMNIIIEENNLAIENPISDYDHAINLQMWLMTVDKDTAVSNFNNSDAQVNDPFYGTDRIRLVTPAGILTSSQSFQFWATFRDTYLQPILSSYGALKAPNIIQRLEPALDVCFVFQRSPFGSDVPNAKREEFLNDNGQRVYMREKMEEEKGEEVEGRIYDAVPGIQSGQGGRGNNHLGSIDLNWQSSDINGAFTYQSSSWFPFGKDADSRYGGEIGDGNTSHGILSCGAIRRFLTNVRVGSNQRLGDFIVLGDDDVATSIDPLEGLEPGAGNLVSNSASSITGSSDVPHVDCGWSLNPLTWLFCPLLDLTQAIVNNVGNAIQDQLDIDADMFFSTADDCPDAVKARTENCKPGEAVYAAWNTVRVVAVSLLIVIGLLMVVGQALNLSFIDAYTIKKVLPRLIVAIIAINLSWEVSRIMIEFSNDVARAVRSIIFAPFNKLGNPGINGDALSAVLVSGGALAPLLGIMGFLSFFATAAIAVLMAFITIILRQMLVVFLVILAPIAIVANILPGTEKGWKLWWGGFTSALFVYPIISGFIAIGAAFGSIAPYSAENFGGFIALIATYIPYFLIPKAFSMAGGLVGTLSGAVNDRSRGVFDRLKNFRKQRTGERFKKFREGGVYSDKTRRGRFGNKFGSWVYDADEMIPYTAGGNTRQGLAGAAGRKVFGNRASILSSKLDHVKMEQTEKIAQAWNKAGMNDKGARTISGSFGRRGQHYDADTWDKLVAGLGATVTEEEDENGNKVQRATLKGGLQTQAQWETAARILQSSTYQTEKKGGYAIARAMPSAMHLKQEGMAYASTVGAAGMILSSHGFADEDDLVAVARNVRDSGGGQHFAEEAGVQMELLGKSAMLKAGYSLTQDDNGEFVNGMTAQDARDWAITGSFGYGDWAAGKSGAAGRKMKVLEEMVEYSAGDATKKAELEAKWASQGHSQATIQKRQEIAQENGQAAIGTLVQLASSISAAPGDTKVKAMQSLKNIGLEHLVQAFDTNLTPEQKAAMQAQQAAAQTAAGLGGIVGMGGPADTGGTVNL